MLRSNEERHYRGIALSGGVALGRVCRFVPAPPAAGTGSEEPEVEKRRLRDAVASLGRRLESLARNADDTVGPGEAAILRVQVMMLGDESLWDAFVRGIEGSGASAERAVKTVLGRFRYKLSRAGPKERVDRSEDVTELESNLLAELGRAAPTTRCHEAAHCQVGQCLLRSPHIMVVSDLTPALVMEVDELTLGLLTARVGPNSHAAILARALGLPAVSLADPSLLLRVPLSADLLIDGDRGEVIVSPSDETRSAYQGSLRTAPRSLRVAQPVEELRVLANIERVSELDGALSACAEGIGLYRTEIEPLAIGRLLDEEEQFERYATVVAAMEGRPVYIRLLDLGGDKGADFLGIPPEENPALGLRGARLLLARPEMLRVQARALARASRVGSIHVIAPMIIDVEQFTALREVFEDEASRVEGRSLRLGVMLEVPSACLQARPLLAAADFACVGTNDLTQYLFAMDRSNAAVAMEGAHHHPVLWSVIESLAAAAREAGRELSVCGELAGDPALTRRLIRAGIRQVSVTPRGIAGVRMAARALSGPREGRAPGP
jgi:phosphoenolpyruvate-protein kinase (PTS system EI component)